MNPKSLFTTVFYIAGLLALIGSCAKEDLGPREFAQLDFVEIVGRGDSSLTVKGKVISLPGKVRMLEYGFLLGSANQAKDWFIEGPFHSGTKILVGSIETEKPFEFTEKIPTLASGGSPSVRAYVLTDQGAVLGPVSNTWDFFSFEPTSGKPGDTITIRAHNLIPPPERCQNCYGVFLEKWKGSTKNAGVKVSFLSFSNISNPLTRADFVNSETLKFQIPNIYDSGEEIKIKIIAPIHPWFSVEFLQPLKIK